MGAILVLGARYRRMRGFRDCMLDQWKPALSITALYLVSTVLGGRSALNPYILAVFGEAMVGLALARSLAGFEPLQVTSAVIRRERPVRIALLALLFAVLAAVVAIIVGSIGLGVLQSIFHETNVTREASSSLSPSKFQAFWLLLAGGGIVEETVFRLVGISLFARLFKARWLAVVLTAVLFGLYHITPLSGMYKTFLQMPVSQVVATIPIGMIWGWLFLRKGYESAVVAHTLCDWLPMLVFG